jgi:hypothetical protein
MRSWLKPVLSFGTTLSQAIRSRPSLALLIVALVGVAAITSLRLFEAHRAGPSPAGYGSANRFVDEEREKLEGVVASRRGMSPSPPRTANATDAVSDGWGRRVIRHAALDVELMTLVK